jgi:monoamine oxidase
MSTVVNVVVVGAGYAGLIAARNLIEAGKSVVVLEASNRVGGRAWSEFYPGTEAIVDWGAEWVLPAHHHALMAEAARYGVALEPSGDTPLPRWQVNGAAFNASFADMVEGNTGVQRILRSFENTAAEYVKTGLEPLVTLADTLAGYAPRDAALVNAALFPLTGAHPKDLSLAMVLNEIRFHGGTIAETIDPAEIARLQGGTGEIANRIAAELPEGTIRFGSMVHGIADHGDNVVASGEFGSIKTQKVILALPLNILKNIAFTPPIPVATKALITDGHAGSTAKFWALAKGDSQPEECFISGHPFRLTYAKPVGQGHNLMCAQALIDEVPDVSEAALKALFAEIYPGQTILEVAMHDWVSDPLALGSWHAGRAGQDVALHAMRQPIGKIRFCGGDFSDPWSGWIEGAILSGAEAAHTFS